MATVKLPEGTKAALVLAVGDADKDGKVGVKSIILADIPLDGSSEAKEIISLPEWEPVDPSLIPDAIAKILKWAAPVLGGVLGFLGGGKK